jgi:hypothetical protein
VLPSRALETPEPLAVLRDDALVEARSKNVPSPHFFFYFYIAIVFIPHLIRLF